jgi:glycosyltransferase involved in cell wall biosynthesis
VYTVPIRRSRVKDGFYLLSSLARRRSFLMERDNLPGMRRLVRALLAKKRYDYALADQLTMTQFLDDVVDGPQRIFDAHNAVYTIVDRMMKEAAPWFMQPVLRSETERVREYEGRIVRRFEHTLAVTEIDKRHLLAAAGPGTPVEKIRVIPIAVDTQAIRPVERQAGSRTILTLGTLHYPPNADGIRWFLREVYPLVGRHFPEACLTIVGKNPPADFVQAAADDPGRVSVTGYVPELEPYMQSAALMVIPVRAGSGMRVRILEAFAAGMPVVTTTVGLEGIEATPGEHVLVADTPEDFAAAVVALLAQPERAQRLAEAGRRLAETAYDWRVVLKRLDAVLGKVEIRG